jgi:hypothetical protein
MKNELDQDLVSLFAEKSEPPQGDIFVARVSKQIGRRRFAQRAKQALIGLAGTAVLIMLTPWLIGLTGYIALGTNLLNHNIGAVMLSPIGFSIGGAGLVFLLKTRL